jgi:hypothetical protein
MVERELRRLTLPPCPIDSSQTYFAFMRITEVGEEGVMSKKHSDAGEGGAAAEEALEALREKIRLEEMSVRLELLQRLKNELQDAKRLEVEDEGGGAVIAKTRDISVIQKVLNYLSLKMMKPLRKALHLEVDDNETDEDAGGGGDLVDAAAMAAKTSQVPVVVVVSGCGCKPKCKCSK